MNARELINDAWYLSGIVSREWETVTGTQASDGLRLLNDFIGETSINGSRIPYYTHDTFNTVDGQEEYSIPGLIDLEELTFNIDNVRYQMVRDTQKNYFGSFRVDDITSLPFHYYAERQLGGTKIYLYFVPNTDYEMRMTGKFALTSVDYDTDLSVIFDLFYTSYLKYALANRLCDDYGYQFTPLKLKTLHRLEKKIRDLPGIDLSINKISGFRSRNGSPDIWALGNLYNGWMP